MKERIDLLHREAQRHRADNCGMHDVDPFVVVAALDQRRDLLAACKPVLAEAKERADYMAADYNPDAHIQLTLTVAELRAIRAAVEKCEAP